MNDNDRKPSASTGDLHVASPLSVTGETRMVIGNHSPLLSSPVAKKRQSKENEENEGDDNNRRKCKPCWAAYPFDYRQDQILAWNKMLADRMKVSTQPSIAATRKCSNQHREHDNTASNNSDCDHVDSDRDHVDNDDNNDDDDVSTVILIRKPSRRSLRVRHANTFFNPGAGEPDSLWVDHGKIPNANHGKKPTENVEFFKTLMVDNEPWLPWAYVPFVSF